MDVLVIGGGGCGLIASLAAAQKGAQVFLVEKEKAAGGNTSLSQAMVPAAGTRFQREAGIEDSVDFMTRDILDKNENGSDPDLTRHVARESAKLVEWMSDSLDIRLELVTEFIYPGHSQYRIHANRTKKGAHLVNELLKATARYDNISIAYNAPAKRLIVDRQDGAVLGAEVEIEGIGKNLARAKKVILALNGFGANREMLAKYIPEMKDAYYFGHEGNTGEGILWGEALGAALECMGAYQAHGSVAHPHGTLLTYVTVSMGGYHVNLDGKRFVNEYHGYSEHALDVLAQKEGVAIAVFDEKIYRTILGYEDFQQCIKAGAVKKFDHIRELALSFHLPPDEMERTHEDFLRAARGEAKDPLGRREFGTPLESPLYGAKVTGALFHTQGGLKINKQAQVIGKDGIPHSEPFRGWGYGSRVFGQERPCRISIRERPPGCLGSGENSRGRSSESRFGFGKIAGEKAVKAALAEQ